MSGLDIDTRSDIYSLGVLLYELLTGKTPFDAKELIEAGLDEMRRTIREKEPSRPSTRVSTMLAAELTTTAKRRSIEAPKLVNLLRGDLDWIVMKALEKDRTRRYETANGFGADIRRHLNNEPVVARPPSTLYKFQKAVRRNRLAYAAAGAVLVALIFGLVMTQRQASRARRAESLANARLAEVAAERDEKEQARKDAEEVSQFLREIFQSPDPARDGRTITVAETLDRAVKKLDASLKEQPERRMRLLETLGATYQALGLYQSAIPLQEQIRDYWMQKAGPEHTNSIRAVALLANSYYLAGRQEEALTMREEALALSRNVYGPEHSNTIGRMHDLANSYSAGRSEDALKVREEVLALSRKVNGAEHYDTLIAMNNLASSYQTVGRLAESLRMREEVLALSRKVIGGEHPLTVMSLGNLANSYLDAGRPEEALKAGEEALALSRKVFGPEHPTTRVALNRLANFLRNARRMEDALKIGEDLLSLSRKVNGPEHPETLAYLHSLANSYQHAGQPSEAVKMYEELLALRNRILGPEHPHTIGTMQSLGDSYDQAGRLKEALKIREELVAFERKKNGSDNLGLFWPMHRLANCYTASGRLEEAIKAREEKAELGRRYYGSLATETIGTVSDLGRTYLRAGRKEEGLKLLSSLPARGIKRWLVLAPIPLERGKNAEALEKELVQNESALRPRAGDAIRIEDRELIWRAHESPDAVLEFNDLMGKETVWSAAYAVCYLKSESDRSGLTLFISSDDQCKAWLNGQEVYRFEKTRGVWDARDHVEGISLRAGVNVLALKVLNGEVGWGACVNFTDAAGNPVEGLRAAVAPEDPGEAFSEPEPAWNWKIARDTLLASFAKNLSAHFDGFSVAPLLLHLGEIPAYENHRQEMLRRFGVNSPFMINERTAKVCLLRPLEGESLRLVSEMADGAVRRAESTEYFPWMAFTKALAEYRKRNFAEAADWAAKVAAARGEYHARDAEASFVLAMARHGLNQPEEARSALAEGIDIVESKLPKLDVPPRGNSENWHDPMIAHALMQEAKALIEGGGRNH